MRLTGALLALTLAGGCVRFGYDARRERTDPKHDAATGDAGSSGTDASLGDDAGGPRDAGERDAGGADASTDAAAAHDAGEDAGRDASGADDDAATPEDDAGMEDRDASTGSPLCPERSDALFCDAFESPALSANAYKLTTNGTVMQTTARARSGTGSLRAATTPSSMRNPEARYGVNVFDNQTSGDIWMRSYYYVPSTVTVNRGFSTCVIAESEPPYFGFSLMVRATRVEIASGDTMYASAMTMPRDRWTCVELHVKIDDMAGYFEAYLDGQLAVRSPETDTLPARGYSSADIGIHYAVLEQNAVEVFVDDAVAGTLRIPCE